MRRVIWAAPVLAAWCVVSACTGSKGSAPSSPTPTPTPAQRTLTFLPETASPSGQSVGITLASRDQEQGKITLAVTGYNLVNNIGGSTVGVWGAVGRVAWDGSLLELDAVESGDFLRQGGAAPEGCQLQPSSAAVAGSTNGFCWQRDTSTARLTGTGDLHLFRLTPRAGVTSGTSPVRFVEGSPGFPSLVVLTPYRAVNANPRETQLDHYYGGTITIQ